MLQVHAKRQQTQAGQENGGKYAPGRRVKKSQNEVQNLGSCQKKRTLRRRVAVVGIHFAREVPRAIQLLGRSRVANRIRSSLWAPDEPDFFTRGLFHGTHCQLYQAG
jgi:hypothetical protein